MRHLIKLAESIQKKDILFGAHKLTPEENAQTSSLGQHFDAYGDRYAAGIGGALLAGGGVYALNEYNKEKEQQEIKKQIERFAKQLSGKSWW
jgi:hypothetical protein